MSWYYYLEGKISFPFRAKCLAANAVSPFRKGKAVEVRQMAVEDSASTTCLCRSVGKAARWQSLSRN